jgi:hypothetical protein
VLSRNFPGRRYPQRAPLNKAIQLREQGRYAEEEKAHLLALAEAGMHLVLIPERHSVRLHLS